jgi:ATP-dependent protease HslVU (ClpYQ) peptidase subunit
MTTIAANREGLAGDSRLISGSTISHGRKVWRRKGAVLGIAGGYAQAHRLVDWFLSGARGDPPELDEVEAVILTRDGRLLHYEGAERPFEVADEFISIGSGKEAAMAAMYMGADPRKAIQVASLVDANTGGPIHYRRRGKSNGKEKTG